MKPSKEPSPHVLVVDCDGCLKPADLPADPAAAIAHLEDTVLGFIRADDNNLLKRIAAGSAAAEIFARKRHRELGSTKSQYCKIRFNRSARSVDSWIEAAANYAAIGGPACAVQPTSLNQLETLSRIRAKRVSR